MSFAGLSLVGGMLFMITCVPQPYLNTLYCDKLVYAIKAKFS